MSDSCCAIPSGTAHRDLRWRRVLWVALVLNLAMFGVEWVAGSAAQSKALQADALDFLGDAANYAISLGVAGMVLAWRARAALLKGATLALLGGWVMISTIWALVIGTAPDPVAMGAVGVAALVVNALVALMLYRFRTGDANMRSVWICSRNDAIGNIAVVAAAVGVFGIGTSIPDLVVAGIMAALGISGGIQIIALARKDLRSSQGVLEVST